MINFTGVKMHLTVDDILLTIFLGYFGIDQTGCEERDCCWSPADVSSHSFNTSIHNNNTTKYNDSHK